MLTIKQLGGRKMKKRLIAALAILTLAFGLTSCTTETKDKGIETTQPVVETFAAEYEMKGTTSAGKPKNDTFIFEGTTGMELLQN